MIMFAEKALECCIGCKFFFSFSQTYIHISPPITPHTHTTHTPYIHTLHICLYPTQLLPFHTPLTPPKKYPHTHLRPLSTHTYTDIYACLTAHPYIPPPTHVHLPHDTCIHSAPFIYAYICLQTCSSILHIYTYTKMYIYTHTLNTNTYTHLLPSSNTHSQV